MQSVTHLGMKNPRNKVSPVSDQDIASARFGQQIRVSYHKRCVFFIVSRTMAAAPPAPPASTRVDEKEHQLGWPSRALGKLVRYH